ncbi:MAG: hypothetical protein IJX71_06145 [Oscillospiraceae bacterium]|nr:hypothetical protein [Oscillospiraceae bacterium]
MPIQALYREAEAILRPQAGQWNIPLRLDEKRGQLLSALPRLLRAKELPFSCPTLPEESSFSALEEAGGMLVFTIRPDWYQAQLEKLNELPWGTVPEETGLRRNDGENEAFLLPYTVRRCRRQWEKGRSGKMDQAMVLQLLKGADPVDLAKGYWRLSPEVRRDGLLAGAAGRIISLSFTKNSSTTHNVRYNVD